MESKKKLMTPASTIFIIFLHFKEIVNLFLLIVCVCVCVLQQATFFNLTSDSFIVKSK